MTSLSLVGSDGAATETAVATHVAPQRAAVELGNRQIAQIEGMIADFRASVRLLDRDIATEEARTKISDPANFAYSTAAMAMSIRREKMLASIETLVVRLAGYTPVGQSVQAA